MSESSPSDIPLPPEMYEGGFRDSAKVVDKIIDRFGLTRPLTIYYPGSSSDISLLSANGVSVIHADSHLSEAMLGGFSSLGAEAHQVDVHEWQPPIPVDMIAFIDPSGIDESLVLANTDLRSQAVVLWYSWSGRPHKLQETEDLRIVGAVTFGEEEGFEIDTEQLNNYFTLKSFEELDDIEQQAFITKVDEYMKQNNFQFSSGNTYSTVYTSWQKPDNYFTAYQAGVERFPYRKETSCFIFQRV